MTPKQISRYMAKIGAIGGSKSRRTLTPEQARKMVEAREAKREQRIELARKAGSAPKRKQKAKP